MAGSAAKVVSIAVLGAGLGGLVLMALLLYLQSDGGDDAPGVNGTPILVDGIGPFPLPAQPERNSLHVIDSDGTDLTELLSAENIWDVQWSPDGRELAFITEELESPALWILDVATGETRELVRAEDPRTSIDYLWSPDGKQLVVSANDQLVLLQPDGTELGLIDGYRPVEWSPDSSSLLVFGPPGDRSIEADLLLVDATTLETHLIARAWYSSRAVARFSPDGKSISYAEPLPATEEPGCELPSVLSIFDPETGTKTQVMDPVCKAINSHAWSPDGRRITFGQVETYGPETNGLRILNLANGTVQQLTEDLDFESVWLPGGEVLAVHRASCWSCGGSSWWALIDEDGTELAEWPSNFPALDIHRTEDVLAVGFTDGRLGLVDRAGAVIATLLEQAPHQFREVAYSPDGESLAFVRWQGSNDTTYTASVDSGEWRGLVLPPETLSARLSPDGELVAYVLNGEIVVANADASEPRVLADQAYRSDDTLEWSPDGSHIAFFKQTDFPEGQVAVVAVEGGAVRPLRPVRIGDLNASLSWSPDSSKLLIVDASSGLGGRTIIEIESGNERPLTGLVAGDITWSPDGTSIASISERGLQVTDIATSVSREALRLGDKSEYAAPAWSPDGKTIAVFETDAAAANAFVTLVAANGASTERIELPAPTPDPLINMRIYNDALNIAWSPDGTLLAINYLAPGGKQHGVFLLDLSTGELQAVSLSSRFNHRHVILSWSLDGTMLTFQSQRYTL